MHPAFHFRVNFGISNDAADVRFQAVSGLEVKLATEEVRVGGENRFTYTLPGRAVYTDVTLRRAMLVSSEVIDWCREAFENFRIRPTTVTISLLDAGGGPVRVWTLARAYPVSWSVGELDAEQNTLTIERITLTYQYFTIN
ncbi:phage tail protein [Neolewinella antarctica]|uniref:Phage tail-like protein n=1 Tax=Neolewinella antarctica TaxID=442734 RepID=A0ABX0X640_9BACT|nr:phage tail protein [Neolewinella antarctica]NJC24671.1 phage tail-like protein [Neolewinella antarctica]